ncbi:MAG TPA: type II toxin-antitoxin system RelE/ParE family toxin [Candidatus Acidoferrum sp.]|nr:type II toxin-antitoxin system RelE/ParE family toxin [Candidatus Acidoferrum sp.]
MASKEVEFHESASLEYEAALDWYLERSEPAAARFADELNRAIAKIAEAPQRWQADNQGTRKFFLTRFPFVIVYRELTAAIQILAVAHGHRRPGYWKKRL